MATHSIVKPIVFDFQIYPAGTKIQIGERRFMKLMSGSFWRELSDIRGNCVCRPSSSLKSIEFISGCQHALI